MFGRTFNLQVMFMDFAPMEWWACGKGLFRERSSLVLLLLPRPPMHQLLIFDGDGVRHLALGGGQATHAGTCAHET